jgi:hypothetical protein
MSFACREYASVSLIQLQKTVTCILLALVVILLLPLLTSYLFFLEKPAPLYRESNIQGMEDGL